MVIIRFNFFPFLLYVLYYRIIFKKYCTYQIAYTNPYKLSKYSDPVVLDRPRYYAQNLKIKILNFKHQWHNVDNADEASAKSVSPDSINTTNIAVFS
jgi:hypothetical protein